MDSTLSMSFCTVSLLYWDDGCQYFRKEIDRSFIGYIFEVFRNLNALKRLVADELPTLRCNKIALSYI